MRRVIAALVVVGLAVAVALFWPRSDPDDTPDTVAGATTTSSTTAAASTTIGGDAASTTLDDGSHVVETVDEAEAILRELWFGWFEGIYNQDEDRIREVVGNPDLVANAVEEFGEMEFDSPPTPGAISTSDVEIVRSDADCLAIWADISAGFREGSITGVHVFRPLATSWLLVNTWPRRGDMWESDCDAQLQP